MTVSIWAYPWDLHDLGMDMALDRIRAAGATCISLATSYHAGRFLQPGNPRRRVYFPQDGTVYYRPDPARWQNAEIAPLPADIVATEGCMLTALTRQRDRGGPQVSCWTVCLHNTRLGMAHPGHVMRTAHGDALPYALCPSSPAACAYVTGLVREITEIYQPDRIEIEAAEFMGFSHGFHHEKDGLPVSPAEDFLLGICFCSHCMAAARSAGIPADAARAQVVARLDLAFGREVPVPDADGFPQDLRAYLDWRHSPVTRLLAQIRAAAHPATQVMVIDYDSSWRGGIDISHAAAQVDGVIYCGYFAPPDRLSTLLSPVRAALGPQKPLIAGFQLFYPNVSGPADLAARVAAARLHADGFNFYNLGLVPPARLGWIPAALAP